MLNKFKLFCRLEKVHLSLFITILFTMVVTISATSAVLYMNFENITSNMIYNSTKDKLMQANSSAEYIKDIAKNLSMQIYSDLNIQKILHYSSPSDMDTNIAIEQMEIYRKLNPYIHSIYIYNSANRMFYISSSESINLLQKNDEFFDKNIIDILNNPDQYKINTLIPRIISEPWYSGVDVLHHANVYTFLFNTAPNSPSNASSTVIVNVSDLWMQEIFKSMNNNNNHKAFIITDDSKIIISNEASPMFTDLSNESFIKRIMNANDFSGFFIEDIKGVKSWVAFVHSEKTKWRFIQVSPYALLIKDIHHMRMMTILFSILLLFIGIPSAIFISFKLSKPINKILSRLKGLELNEHANKNRLKQEYITKFLHTSDEYNIEQIYGDFAKHNIAVSPDELFILVLFSIDYYTNFCDNYSYKDQNLYKFGIKNIASELICNHYKTEAITLEGNQVLLILNILDTESVYEEITDVIKEIQCAVERHLNISLSCVVSSILFNVNEMNRLYSDIVNQKKYKMFCHPQSIIIKEKNTSSAETEFVYPLDKEKDLIELIKLGKINQTFDTYHEITRYAISCSYDAFTIVLTRLTLAMNDVINAFKKNSSSFNIYNSVVFLSQIDRVEFITEIDKLFLDLFKEIAAEQEKLKDTKHDAIILKITDIINENFNDQNLSIITIADTIKMSPAYIGRLFKKLTSTTIPNAINDVRMQKALNFLDSTSYSISEIVEHVGFTNEQYFYKVFKKTYGVTPNNYRQRSHFK